MMAFSIPIFLVILISYISENNSIDPETIAESNEIILRVDSSKSMIKWRGTKMMKMGKHEGIIKISKGEIILREGRITGGNFEIDMNSLEITDMPKHETIPRRRLMNDFFREDFFDINKYPVSFFEISSSKYSKDMEYLISGDLTMKGVSIAITFLATFTSLSENEIEAQAEITLDRQEWGISFNALQNAIVDDEFYLWVNIVAQPMLK